MVAYRQIVVDYCPLKLSQTGNDSLLGGHQVQYPWDLCIPTVDLKNEDIAFQLDHIHI